MPVSQSRIIDLINAALDYKRGLDNLIDHVKADALRAREHPEHAAGLFEGLEAVAQTNTLMEHAERSLATLVVEHEHFRRNARRNDRTARKQAAKRQQAGVIPRSKSPRDVRLHSASDLPRTISRPQFQFLGVSPERLAENERIGREIIKAGGYDRDLAFTEMDKVKQAMQRPEQLKECPYCNSPSVLRCRKQPCQWLADINALEAAEAAEADAIDFDSNEDSQ